METDYKGIQKAVEIIKNSDLKRLDGDGFKAYRVGQIIRVDIQDKAQ